MKFMSWASLGNVLGSGHVILCGLKVNVARAVVSAEQGLSSYAVLSCVRWL